MHTRTFILAKYLSLILFISLVCWVIFTILSFSEIQPDWSEDDLIQWAGRQNLFFSLNYFNAAILTILIIIVYTCVFLYLKESHPHLAFTGIIFVPIYGALNIVVYSSQITILPTVIGQASSLPPSPAVTFFILQWMQAHDGSIIGILNGLAYSILGIPSVTFGIALITKNVFGKIAGITLILNAIFCLFGVLSTRVDNVIFAQGTSLGGLVFIVSIFFVFLMFHKEIRTS